VEVSNRLLLVLAGVVAVLGVALVIVLTGDSTDAPVIEVQPTQTVQPEAAVGEIVNRFVEALGTNDTDTLYSIQSDAYKQVCNRASFQSVADKLHAQPLEGPARVVVQGETAAAQLREVQADGSLVPVIIPLILQADGTWRLAAPSLTGCTP
jgi:hypothetical protein